MVTRSRLHRSGKADMKCRLKKVYNYKEQIEGEGWAINDYKGKIAEAKTENEKKVLTHIMNEEKEHLSELLELENCKKE